MHQPLITEPRYSDYSQAIDVGIKDTDHFLFSMTNSEVMRKCLHRERDGERGRMCRCLQQSVFSEPDVDNDVHKTGWLAYTVQGE